jgi:hypothetical protein
MLFANVFMEISLELEKCSGGKARRQFVPRGANERQPQYDALQYKEKSRLEKPGTGWFAAHPEGLRRPFAELPEHVPLQFGVRLSAPGRRGSGQTLPAY